MCVCIFFVNVTPVQVPGAECPAGTMECGREGCVDLRKVCDGTDDCGDNTDEQDCGETMLEFLQSSPVCLCWAQSGRLSLEILRKHQ